MTADEIEILEQLIDDIRAACEILEEADYIYLPAELRGFAEEIEVVIEDEA